ncbi:glycosyltransferase [Sphingomonas sp.]|uniref:glycosyltransferase n=1 Tax=Sphingomonas sp. TaxID=28214 RepID=UPI0025D12E0E|nr:glycosyltransferase [Sphingomonas sp.]MBV9527158.1 polysaccharide deacetylase family protein [Sphingomonas sp.]
MTRTTDIAPERPLLSAGLGTVDERVASQPSRTSPSFSIVIPTYRRREVVCDAVRALASVRHVADLELIVVVDGSNDGTAEALAAIDCPFPLRVIDQPNAGAARARNRGAHAARHEVILFLDDDMICGPDLIEHHSSCYRDGADAVIGDTVIDDDSPRGFLPRSVARWIESTRVRTPLSPFDIFTGQLSVRKAVFDRIGGFDPQFTTGSAFGNEDADFGVDLLEHCDVRHNPSAVTRQRYVVSPREYSERAARAVQADLRLIRKRPQLAKPLFEEKGWSSPVTRFVYRPLSKVPLLAKMLAAAAVRLSEAALSTPFHSNRLLARFFSATRSLSYWSELRAAGGYPFSKRPLILCYHAIEDHRDDPLLSMYSVPPALFEKHLDRLTARGFSFISPEQYAQFLAHGAPLPRRPVLLTFDDGYASMVRLARGTLASRGISAILFVVTGASSGTNEWDQPHGARQVRLLDAAELAGLVEIGLEIGSHSRTHRELPRLSPSGKAAEIRGSADDLERATGVRPRFFAYPYGALDDASEQAVRASGFTAGFAVAYKHATSPNDRYRIPRVMILASDDGWRFRLKTTAPRLFGRLLQLRSLPGRVTRRMNRLHAR